MMLLSHVKLLLSLALLCNCVFAAKPPRVFSEDYIEGLYGRFFEFAEEGSSDPCPNVIDHFQRGSPSALGNSWIVPHDKIVQQGAKCNDSRVLTLNSFDSLSTIPDALNSNAIARETFSLMKRDSTGFWMGPDYRECGKWTFPNPTYIFFVREFDRSINSFFNVELEPGKKYMFVVATSFTCIYEDIPRDGESNVQPDVIIDASQPDSEPGTEETTANPVIPIVIDDGEGDDEDDGDSESSTSTNPAQSPSAITGSEDLGEGESEETDTPASDVEISIVDIENGVSPQPTVSPTDDVSIVDLDEAEAENEGESDSNGSDDGNAVADEDTIFGNADQNVDDALEAQQGESVCFPGDALVELEDGGFRRMDELSIGDKVRVGPNEFSTVFTFTHKMPTTVNEFVQITTSCGAILRLTGGHMLYINGQLGPAGEVRIGDVLILGNGKDTAVVDMNKVRRRGLYNPQTLHGNLVVNNVLTTTFTTTIHACTAQGLLAPVRAIWNAMRTDLLNGLFEQHAIPSNLFSML